MYFVVSKMSGKYQVHSPNTRYNDNKKAIHTLAGVRSREERRRGGDAMVDSAT